MGRAPSLHLRIRTEWALHEFHLKPGDSLVAGRSPDAQIPIPRRSVSVEHVKISWDGLELTVKDLNSSNGTFRMPQDSPFIEACFPPKFEQLVLRLSKSLIELSWQPFHSSAGTQVTGFEATRTEMGLTDPSGSNAGQTHLTRTIPDPFLSTEKTLAGAVLGESEENERPEEQTHSMPGAKLAPTGTTGVAIPIAKPAEAPVASQSPRIGPTREEVAMGEKIAVWCLIAAGSVGLLVLSIVVGVIQFAGILRAPQSLLRQGGMVDVVMLWARAMENQSAIIFGALVASVAVAVVFARGAAKNPNEWVQRWGVFFAKAKFPTPFLLRVLSLITLSLCLLWPAIAGLLYGVSPSAWSASIRYWQITEKKDLSHADAVKAYKELLPALEGSSILYKTLFERQRERVVQECGGIGDTAPWEKKKVCLVLLAAVGIETLEETRPALLSDIAARAAVLLSLDGITRVITTEGLQAPTIPFFLNSLEAVGLGAEQEDIAKLLYTGGLDPLQATAALHVLRQRIEQILQDRQLELRYPTVLSFSVPGPLETGI